MNKLVLTSILVVFMVSFGFAQSNGELSVSVTTTAAGGEYAPRNIVAVWIEDASGKFVKTLLAFADKRKNDLTTWKSSTINAGSQYNVVDAITSATKNSHDTRVCKWNGTDFNKNLVADGKYKICMELADGSRKNSSFEFEKGSLATTLTPANVSSFSNIKLVWTPTSTTSVTTVESDSEMVLFPNPTNGFVEVKGNSIKEINVINSQGQRIISTRSQVFNLTDFPKGVYVVQITAENKTIIRKLIKQ